MRISSSFDKATSIGKTKWRDVQAKLQPGETAIEFLSFRYRKAKAWTDSTMYMALVLRKDDVRPVMVPLCEQRQLDSLFAAKGSSDASFVSNLYRGLTMVFVEENTISYGKRLYRLVWQPMEHLLTPGKRIYFAPSGVLHQVAFSAIPVSEDTLLSDRFQLEQLSTTARLAESPSLQDKPGSAITLYGGIQMM